MFSFVKTGFNVLTKENVMLAAYIDLQHFMLVVARHIRRAQTRGKILVYTMNFMEVYADHCAGIIIILAII
jgi:hypothetical protein